MTNQPNNAVILAANQASSLIPMTVNGDGPAEVVAFSQDSTGAALIMMTVVDGQMGNQKLMNTAIHMGTIFGSGALPYRLPESLLVDEGRSIRASFTNLTAVQNSVRPLGQSDRGLRIIADPKMERQTLRMRRRQFLSLPYFYTFDQLGYAQLNAGVTASFPISIEETAHFELHTLTAVATDPAWDLNIVDTTKSESLMDGFGSENFPIPSALIVGTANFPWKLHEPRFFSASSKLVVQITNRAAIQNRIYLTLGGRRLSGLIWK